MGLLPDRLTAQCPWRADTHKPVLLRVTEEESDVDEEAPDENGKRKVRADPVPLLQSIIWTWMASMKKTNRKMNPS